MSRNDVRNVAASVRQKLLNRSRAKGEDFLFLITRYALERFLYRLGRSVHNDRFVLKGALLFALWEGDLHRVTRDVDLLGFGSPALPEMERVIREICEADVEDDGMLFLPNQVRSAPIREDQEYEGVRIVVPGRLATARVRLQIDVAFGDAVTPQPEEAVFPTLLDAPAPVLRTYPRETVVAEKLQAMVMLGIANSRMKDFFDVAYLARHFSFGGPLLVKALTNTFTRRRTALPTRLPMALTDEFAKDRAKQTQWSAFVRKAGLEVDENLDHIIAHIRDFAAPPLSAAASGVSFEQTWVPPGPWR